MNKWQDDRDDDAMDEDDDMEDDDMKHDDIEDHDIEGDDIEDGDIEDNFARRMRTAVPGPRSVELKKELNSMQEMSSVTFFADYDKSYGGAASATFAGFIDTVTVLAVSL